MMFTELRFFSVVTADIDSHQRAAADEVRCVVVPVSTMVVVRE